MPAVLTVLKTFTYEPKIMDNCTRYSFGSIKLLLEFAGSQPIVEGQGNLELSETSCNELFTVLSISWFPHLENEVGIITQIPSQGHSTGECPLLL